MITEKQMQKSMTTEKGATKIEIYIGADNPERVLRN